MKVGHDGRSQRPLEASVLATFKRIGCLFFLTGAFLGIFKLQASAQDKGIGHNNGFEAWILAFDGRVWLERANEEAVLVTPSYAMLRVDDRLRLESGSMVELLYRSGSRKTFQGPGYQTIVREGEESHTWQWIDAIRSFFDKPPFVRDGTPRGSAKSGPPVLLAPSTGQVLTPRPSVLWLGRSTAEARISITLQTRTLSSAYRETVWTRNSVGELLGNLKGWIVFELDFPSMEEDLVAGKSYSLSIRRRMAKKPEDTGAFSVVSVEDRDIVAMQKRDIDLKYPSEGNDVTAGVVYAVVLYQKGLYHQAFHCLWEAQKKQPDSPAIHQLLNLILGKT